MIQTELDVSDQDAAKEDDEAFIAALGEYGGSGVVDEYDSAVLMRSYGERSDENGVLLIEVTAHR